MNTLYLIRHGENTANITKEFSHRLVDYSLTPKGVLQAQQTGEYFKSQQIDALYCSPLKRAIETAEIIGRAIGIRPVVMEEFREVNVGALEALGGSAENWATHDSIVRAWFEGQPDLMFPEGENYHMLLERMRSGIEQILREQNGKTSIIVGHGGIFTFTLKDICRNVDLTMLITSYGHNCSITEIEMHAVDDQLDGVLKRWAAFDHLSGEAAAFVTGHLALDEAQQG
jgi:2,3-bisphosphoglycerate-dependent phosphoglycerate mutase